jgi:hypothetical protein
MREAFPSLRQRTFPVVDDATSFAWCFAIETDGDGIVSSVWVAAFSIGEELIYSYEIPFGESGKIPIVPLIPPAVPIAAPIVSPPVSPVSLKKTSDGDG